MHAYFIIFLYFLSYFFNLLLCYIFRTLSYECRSVDDKTVSFKYLAIALLSYNPMVLQPRNPLSRKLNESLFNAILKTRNF